MKDKKCNRPRHPLMHLKKDELVKLLLKEREHVELLRQTLMYEHGGSRRHRALKTIKQKVLSNVTACFLSVD